MNLSANTGFLLRLKRLVKKLPVVFTKNQQYDSQTKQIIRKVCAAHSNTVDVGTHHGDILDLLVQQSPNGTHYGFEPLPGFYESVLEKLILIRDKGPMEALVVVQAKKESVS